MRISTKTFTHGLTAAFVLTIGLFAADTAKAERRVIECPASITGKVVNAPARWTALETTRDLQNTRVIEDGRRDILRCAYGQAGRIQRQGPQDATCRAVDRGFVCEVPDPRPVTHSTGQRQIDQTFTINLDNGNVGAGGADLWLQAPNAIVRLLTPRNGAVFSVGPNQRGYDGCKTASFSSNSMPLITVPVGTYVCYKTDQGRIGEFRMNDVDRQPTTKIRIGYTTWAN